MTEQQTPYPIYNTRFWAAYFIHLRPYLLFLSGAAGLAGMAVGWGEAPPWDWRMLAFFFFFLSYGFGQALTDCFQMDTDKLSAPYRPLSRGLVTPQHVGIVSLAGLLLVGGVLVWANPWNLPLVLLSIFGLATYSYFKRLWWAGPFYNAWIVLLLPVMGFLAMSGESLRGLSEQPAAFYYLPGLSFFSYANFVLMGYLKDISADRATGYRTFPVAFGWNATVWAGDVLAFTAMFFLYQALPSQWEARLFFFAGTLIALAGQLSAHLAPEHKEEQATFAIIATVRSFILWHLAVLSGHWEGSLFPALVFYLLFELALWGRPESSQI